MSERTRPDAPFYSRDRDSLGRDQRGADGWSSFEVHREHQRRGSPVRAAIPGAPARGVPAAAPAPEKGPQYLKFPGKHEGLVVLGERPLVAETPESLLDHDTTPIEKFYIRNNGQIPEETKNPDAWKITIDGEVNNKIEITLGELKSKYKAVTRRMVLECGGNGRAAFSPPARGNQWTNCGSGCAQCTRAPASELVKAAGLYATFSSAATTFRLSVTRNAAGGCTLPTRPF